MPPTSTAAHHASSPILILLLAASIALGACASAPPSTTPSSPAAAAATTPAPRARHASHSSASTDIATVEVTFDSLGDALSGVIQFPDGATAPAPAVLILHDAGPHDRDGHFQAELGVKLPVEVAVYQEMAEYLVRRGFVVMRFDKRTCVEGGRAWCTYPRAYLEPHRPTLAEALQADAAAALTRLKSDPRVDATRTAVLGHGQGADLAAALMQSSQLAALILLAPSPYPIDELLKHQTTTSLEYLREERLEAGDTTRGTLLAQQIADLEASEKVMEKGFAALRAGKFSEAALLGTAPQTWRGLLTLHDQARAELLGAHVPTLALFGQAGLSLPANSADAFRQLLADASTHTARGAAHFQVVELPATTHFLVGLDDDNQSFHVSDTALTYIFDFLQALPPAPGR